MELVPTSDEATQAVLISLQSRPNHIDLEVCLLELLGKMRDRGAIDPLIKMYERYSARQPINQAIILALSAIAPTDTRVLDNLIEAFQNGGVGASEVLHADATQVRA